MNKQKMKIKCSCRMNGISSINTRLNKNIKCSQWDFVEVKQNFSFIVTFRLSLSLQDDSLHRGRVQSLNLNSLVNTCYAFDARPRTMIIVYIMALNAPLWSWKERCIFLLPLNASWTPVVRCDLWALLQMLGAVPVWGLTSTHWLPLFVHVYV